MKTILTLAAVSALSLGMVSAASAQEYGSVPNSAYQDNGPVETGLSILVAPRFQALAMTPRHDNTVNEIEYGVSSGQGSGPFGGNPNGN